MLVIHVSRDAAGHCSGYRVMMSIVARDAANDRTANATLRRDWSSEDQAGGCRNGDKQMPLVHDLSPLMRSPDRTFALWGQIKSDSTQQQIQGKKIAQDDPVAD